MDKAAFIKELRSIFLNVNSKEKKYARVWLSEANFGGLYHSGKYRVNIKPFYNTEIKSDEIKDAVYMLRENLDPDDKEKYLYTIKVYNANDEIYSEPGDIVLLNEEPAY